jgi:long-chain fatty acid transport protein
MRLKLPAILRAGVEVRPLDALRVELGYSRELWSSHESIDILPEDVRILGVTGIPSPFPLPEVSIPRRFKDSHAFRLGGEYALAVGELALEARAGLSYEQSAIPAAYVSPLTVDTDKVSGSAGLGVRMGARWRMDAVYSQSFGGRREVTPGEAAVPRINPLAGADFPAESINGGSYQARTSILGLGLQYRR